LKIHIFRQSAGRAESTCLRGPRETLCAPAPLRETSRVEITSKYHEDPMTSPTPDPDLETILLDIGDDGIALLTFNRPKVRNALNLPMVNDIRRALTHLGERGDIRALIMTGKGGRAFISGADIAELRHRQRDDAFRRINNSLLREVESFYAPTIAAVQGYALGGGCELAMACDLRVCGESAKFGQPEVGLGIIPGAGGTYRLPRLVGLGMARELIFTGRIVDAQEARAIGLVNRVVADDAVIDAARELARDIARNSALAVRFAKMAINSHTEMSVDTAMAFEATAQAILFDDEEKNRRMSAFLERRAERRKARERSEAGGDE
jgi:enoyl-CoA hydratase